MKPQNIGYVIKAVGYNMWVQKVDNNPQFILPQIKMTLIYENSLVFKNIHDAELVLMLMNSPKGDIEYIIILAVSFA